MPASRPRKKAQEKIKKEKRIREENARTSAFKRLSAAFSQATQRCTTCQSERVEVCLEEVETSHRIGVEKMLFEMMESGMEADQLLYCEKCNAYSALSSSMPF